MKCCLLKQLTAQMREQISLQEVCPWARWPDNIRERYLSAGGNGCDGAAGECVGRWEKNIFGTLEKNFQQGLMRF